MDDSKLIEITNIKYLYDSSINTMANCEKDYVVYDF